MWTLYWSWDRDNFGSCAGNLKSIHYVYLCIKSHDENLLKIKLVQPDGIEYHNPLKENNKYWIDGQYDPAAWFREEM